MADLYIGNRSNTTIIAAKPDISTATVTLASSNFVYDGTTKTQVVSSVALGSQTLVEGTDYVVANNQQIDAGTYTLKIYGIRNYCGIATVEWSIGKIQGSISASQTDFNIIGTTATTTLTIVGDGTIDIISSNANIATASINNNVLTITTTGTGNATITVTLNNGTNYIGDSVVINVNALSVNPILSDNTPAQIQAAAQAGIGSTIWSVGDRTAEISFRNTTVGILSFYGLSACAFIIGFDHNSDLEGTGIHFQFGMDTSGTKIAFADNQYNTSGSTAGFRMNSTETNAGGWESSYMRTNICTQFLSALPTAWRNVISPAIKYTNNVGQRTYSEDDFTSTSDKIWLLANFEVIGWAGGAYGESFYQLQYDYYKNGNSNVFYKYSDTSSALYWWTRSPYSSNSTSFCPIPNTHITNVYSTTYSYTANVSSGFAPGFKIA